VVWGLLRGAAIIATCSSAGTYIPPPVRMTPMASNGSPQLSRFHFIADSVGRGGLDGRARVGFVRDPSKAIIAGIVRRSCILPAGFVKTVTNERTPRFAKREPVQRLLHRVFGGPPGAVWGGSFGAAGVADSGRDSAGCGRTRDFIDTAIHRHDTWANEALLRRGQPQL